MLPLVHYLRILLAFIHTHGFPNCAEFEGMSVASLLSRSFQTTPKRTNVVVLLPSHRKICNMKLSCGFSSFQTCTHFHTWSTSKSKKPGLMEHVSSSLVGCQKRASLHESVYKSLHFYFLSSITTSANAIFQKDKESYDMLGSASSLSGTQGNTPRSQPCRFCCRAEPQTLLSSVSCFRLSFQKDQDPTE